MKDNSNVPLKSPDNKQWVYFLDTHNYHWVKNENLKPYKKFKNEYQKKRNDSAVKEMDDIISEWRFAAVVLSKLVLPVVLANVTKDASYKIPLVPYEPSVSSIIRRSNTKSPKVNNTQVAKRKPRSVTETDFCKKIKLVCFAERLLHGIFLQTWTVM